MDQEVQAGGLSPRNSVGPTHLPLNKIGPHDDPKTLLDLLEKSAEACGWPRDHWTVRLISLLSVEVQVVAQQLPIQNLLVYTDLKRAILQWVGLSPEQHRQLFRPLDQGDSGRPFMLAQQLRDACRKWVLPGESFPTGRRADPRPSGAGIVHQPSPKEDGRVGPVPPADIARPGQPIGGGPDGGVPRSLRIPASCLSLSLSLCLSLSLFLSVPFPRSHPGISPRVPPRRV